jgi:hypothetical protein
MLFTADTKQEFYDKFRKNDAQVIEWMSNNARFVGLEMSDADMAAAMRMVDGMVAAACGAHGGGHFAEAVLRNDLVGAVSRADEDSLRLLPLYVRFLVNNVPQEYVEEFRAGGLPGKAR